MKVYMNIDYCWVEKSTKKSDGVREAMLQIEKLFSDSPLASCCELKLISAAYDKYRRNAALMYWVNVTDTRAYNILKLKWSEEEWQTALDLFLATQVDDGLEDNHFGELVDMDE